MKRIEKKIWYKQLKNKEKQKENFNWNQLILRTLNI